ncbi:MAG: hypothetical protein AAF361_02945, partial [Bacteroidota bacterium]
AHTEHQHAGERPARLEIEPAALPPLHQGNRSRQRERDGLAEEGCCVEGERDRVPPRSAWIALGTLGRLEPEVRVGGQQIEGERLYLGRHLWRCSQ